MVAESGAPPVDAGCDDGDGDGICDENDCAPADINAWQEVTLYPDLDDDGYTAAPVTGCIGSGPPDKHLLVAQPPPRVSLSSQTHQSLTGSGLDWTDLDHQVLFPDSSDADVRWDETALPSEHLTLTDWGFNLDPSATILGIRIHVHRRGERDGDTLAVVEDNNVQLVSGGFRVGDNLAQVGSFWDANNWEWVTYGSKTDTWNASLTATLINNASFGVAIQAIPDHFAESLSAEIDHVWIEIFTNLDVDCDDGDAAAWTIYPMAPDGDGDFYTPDLLADACVGPILSVPFPPGLGTVEGDCFDDNANAYPGQTSRFSVDRGDGSFDYNCDGMVSKGSVTQAVSCMCNVSNICTATNDVYTPTADCGTSTSDDVCGGACLGSCTLMEATSDVKCR
jgi:hypothetical protein